MVVFRVITALVVAVSSPFTSLSSSQTSDVRPPVNEFVRQIIDNELQAEKNDHSHWMLRLETRKSGKTEIREVVETKDGDLDWLISVDGKPLPEDQRSERERGLQRLISNPAELKRSQREKDEDQARSQRLLKMLPDALVFEYGEQRGDLVELKFKPKPHFRPPSHEAAVVHAMEGVLWVNGRQKRLAEISGHLTHPVKFGGGLLGHLDAGGHFYVKQEEVQPGYWELAILDVDMKGKALFFKTIGVQEEIKRSVFRKVRDDLTPAQGASLLYQEVRTTGGLGAQPAPDRWATRQELFTTETQRHRENKRTFKKKKLGQRPHDAHWSQKNGATPVCPRIVVPSVPALSSSPHCRPRIVLTRFLRALLNSLRKSYHRGRWKTG